MGRERAWPGQQILIHLAGRVNSFVIHNPAATGNASRMRPPAEAFITAGSAAGSAGLGRVPAAATAAAATERDPDRAASDLGRDRDWACG
jgi:hypothetical protein